MIEFLVGLVTVMVLLAMLHDLVYLTRAKADTMLRARRDAGEQALADLAYGRDPFEGAEHVQAIARRAASDSDPEGWSAVMEPIARNPVRDVARSPRPLTVFDLVASDVPPVVVPLLPATRNLIYRAPSVSVHSEVFLPKLGNIDE